MIERSSGRTGVRRGSISDSAGRTHECVVLTAEEVEVPFYQQTPNGLVERRGKAVNIFPVGICDLPRQDEVGGSGSVSEVILTRTAVQAMMLEVMRVGDRYVLGRPYEIDPTVIFEASETRR